MKILFISLMDGSPWGGSEELWYKVAREAIEKGHEIYVCVKYWPVEVDKVKILKEKGAKVVFRKPDSKPKRILRLLGLGMHQKATHYLKILQKSDADTILISQGDTFSFFNNDPIVGFIQHAKKPYYLISHFNSEFGGIVTDEVKKEIKLIEHKWSRFYFVSKRNLLTAERQLAGKLENSEVIGNLISVDTFLKIQWPINNSSYHLACVARYECAFKGQDILIQTLAEPEFEKIDFVLNLYGKGPDEKHLHELINFYKLGQRVFIYKFLDNVDLIWETHHVLVLPSIAEGTPLALQEAMLKGRPALVTDVGGNSSLVIDNDTGFLAATASVNSLKIKLIQLFSTPMTQLEQMGFNAFEKAKNEIDLMSSSKILLELETKMSI